MRNVLYMRGGCYLVPHPARYAGATASAQACATLPPSKIQSPRRSATLRSSRRARQAACATTSATMLWCEAWLRSDVESAWAMCSPQMR